MPSGTSSSDETGLVRSSLSTTDSSRLVDRALTTRIRLILRMFPGAHGATPGLVRTSVGHRPPRLADLQQPDLPQIDMREGVRDERVEARLVDLHVEDRSAPGGNEH